LKAPVAADDENAVVYERGHSFFVEARGEMLLGNGKADRVGDALAERPRGDLDAVEQHVLRMSRCDAVELAKLLQIIRGRALVPREVQHGVKQRA